MLHSAYVLKGCPDGGGVKFNCLRMSLLDSLGGIMMNARLLFLVLASFLLQSGVVVAETFMDPIAGWVLHPSDTYDTFKEDENHPCNSKKYDGSKCRYLKNEDGKVPRDCGYNSQCSFRGKTLSHTAWDYDHPEHKGHGASEWEQYGKGVYHGSVDDIVASNDGKVVKVVRNGHNDHLLGNTVIIRHWCDDQLCKDGKIYTQYSHLSAILVEKEQFVGRGQTIGRIGGTAGGKKNGWIDHLHFEFKIKPTLGDPATPNKYYGYAPAGKLYEFGYRDPGHFIGKVGIPKGMADVSPEQWYYEYIKRLAESGVIGGYPDGTFGPNKEVTRAEFLKMILAIYARKTDAFNKYHEPVEPSYTDVPEKHWAYRYVEFAREKELATGSGGKFSPDKPILRAEAAKMLLNSGKLEGLDLKASCEQGAAKSAGDFVDVRDRTDAWFYVFVDEVSKKCIFKGYSDGSFHPERRLTRAEAAKILVVGLLE